ncbi:MAG TPA: sugar phosphate isomerase/epimerase [Chthoniobacterales bacterium]|nr:sugar phosphate isomerase/epimerase [Chthoniobacterales bacterium]
MRIATAPVNWNNADVTGYRPWTPYPQLLDDMVAAGYVATEWGMNMEKDVVRLREDLGARKLQLLGGFVGLELRNPDKKAAEIQRGLELAAFFRDSGASFLIVADSGDSRRLSEAGHVNPASGLSNEQWGSLRDGLNELGNRLAPQGVKVVFHNHVGTYVETQEETARLLDETDPQLVSWCFDCGHLAYGGGDNLAMLAGYGNRIGYVHIKDLDQSILEQAKAHGWSFAQALKSYIFAPLGEGAAGIPEVIEKLRLADYDGWLVIEQDTTPGDPTEMARKNREYLEGLLAQLPPPADLRSAASIERSAVEP